MLKLKSVLKQTDDKKRLDKFAVKRTMSSAVSDSMSYLQDKNLGAGHILYISHADALESAKAICALFEKTYKELEVQILELSPAFVTQGGPRCVAIQYIAR